MVPPAARFVVDKIADQAAIDHIALSDIERNMLLFSETSPTLSNIAAVNEVFERDYDRIDYERKIVRLIRHLQAETLQDPESNRAWKQAVGRLRGEEYYVLVMLNESGFNRRPRGDVIWLIGTGLVVTFVIVSIALFSAH